MNEEILRAIFTSLESVNCVEFRARHKRNWRSVGGTTECQAGGKSSRKLHDFVCFSRENATKFQEKLPEFFPISRRLHSRRLL
jgi:hypothetical protein